MRGGWYCRQSAGLMPTQSRAPPTPRIDYGYAPRETSHTHRHHLHPRGPRPRSPRGRRACRPRSGHHRMRGVEEDLQRCHALLTVDNRMPRHIASVCGDLLQDDRSKKVTGDAVECVAVRIGCEQSQSNATNVTPKWCPLVFFVPHVGALERRNLVLDLPVKEVSRSESVSLHGRSVTQKARITKSDPMASRLAWKKPRLLRARVALELIAERLQRHWSSVAPHAPIGPSVCRFPGAARDRGGRD